jgi:nucleoside-diphosphate-sugar epimerase
MEDSPTNRSASRRSVIGDRDGGLDPLRGREFDAVVDMCGYFPRVVRQSVELLKPTAERYLFVSSISVYAKGARPGFDERAPVLSLDDPRVEEIRGDTYGGLKVLCEREVERGFPGRSIIVRPGLIVGPFDRSDRFTYWVRRIARGGDVLAPGPPHIEVQLIDARDLASWMVRLVDGGPIGVFNATGPDRPLTMEELLETCRDVTGSEARFVWVDDAFLIGQRVDPMWELPFWIPESEPDVTAPCDVSRAVGAGLRFRPLPETISDTLAWDRGRSQDQPMQAGLREDREHSLLEKWGSGG